MSRYVRNPAKTFTFDGDTITAHLKPLTALDLALLGDSATRSDEIRLMGDAVERNVISIDGLNDSDGNPIDVQTVARDAYFVQLASEMFKALVELSQPRNP